MEAVKRLTVTAPCAGMVVESSWRQQSEENSPQIKLPGWHGNPLERENLGANLAAGTHLLSVAPNDGLEATLLVDQHKRDVFTVGRSVRICLDAKPGKVFRGQVQKVSPWTTGSNPAMDSPESADARLAKLATRQGDERWFQAKVHLSADGLSPNAGMNGKARVWVTDRTAAQWVWRQFRITFHQRL